MKNKKTREGRRGVAAERPGFPLRRVVLFFTLSLWPSLKYPIWYIATILRNGNVMKGEGHKQGRGARRSSPCASRSRFRVSLEYSIGYS